ncbi:MAG: hypothetical protein AAB362_00320 [Patescibacteria group bacterium]
MEQKKQNIDGMTLIEAVIAVGIFSLIAMALVGFQSDFFQLNRLVEGGLSRENQIRKIFKSFTDEVRSASPSSVGGYLIESANGTELSFFADIDNDALKERIRYFLSGAILKKGIIKPTGLPLAYNPANEIISDIVSDLVATTTVFSYYNLTTSTSTPLSVPIDVSLIRFIRMTMSLDPNGPKPPGQVMFSTQVNIRNLRFQ